MPLEIVGEIPEPLNKLVKEALHRALDARRQKFVVQISRPHAELIVHVQEPLDRRLKFNRPMEDEIARELYSVVTEIVDEAFGPTQLT